MSYPPGPPSMEEVARRRKMRRNLLITGGIMLPVSLLFVLSAMAHGIGSGLACLGDDDTDDCRSQRAQTTTYGILGFVGLVVSAILLIVGFVAGPNVKDDVALTVRDEADRQRLLAAIEARKRNQNPPY